MPRRHQSAAAVGIELPAEAAADRRPWHAVVMSRLGRNPLARRLELATLYRWTEQAIAQGDAPLLVIGSAAQRWVQRACELLDADAVQLALAGDPAANHRRLAADVGKQGTHILKAADRSLPRDALAIRLADRVDVALVRRGGTIHRLLLQRLAEDPGASVRVLIPVDRRGQAAVSGSVQVCEQLIAAGAVGYCCRWDAQRHDDPLAAGGDAGGAGSAGGAGGDAGGAGSVPRDRQRASATAGADAWATVAAAAQASLLDQPQRWLIHWTRARTGAWPGQSEQQFRDWLLLSRPQPAELSPLETLSRIVRQRRLVGTSRTIRGEQAVVCFSALPLRDVIQRRVFRAHLGRWDAEPYGLAIDRGAAERSGAQRVIYTDPGEHPQIAADQAWRQQARGRALDWTAEQEWRLPAAVDLRPLSARQAIVFVDRCDQVAALQQECPWPVIAIQALPPIACEGVANRHRLG